jgi:hypothetical protein
MHTAPAVDDKGDKLAVTGLGVRVVLGVLGGSSAGSGAARASRLVGGSQCVDAREIAEDRVAVEKNLSVRDEGQEVLRFKAGGGGAGARKLADKAHGPVVSCGDGATPDSRTGKGVPGITFAFAAERADGQLIPEGGEPQAEAHCNAESIVGERDGSWLRE